MITIVEVSWLERKTKMLKKVSKRIVNSVTRAAHGAVFRLGGIFGLIKTILNKQGKPISLGLN